MTPTGGHHSPEAEPDRDDPHGPPGTGPDDELTPLPWPAAVHVDLWSGSFTAHVRADEAPPMLYLTSGEVFVFLRPRFGVIGQEDLDAAHAVVAAAQQWRDELNRRFGTPDSHDRR